MTGLALILSLAAAAAGAPLPTPTGAWPETTTETSIQQTKQPEYMKELFRALKRVMVQVEGHIPEGGVENVRCEIVTQRNNKTDHITFRYLNGKIYPDKFPMYSDKNHGNVGPEKYIEITISDFTSQERSDKITIRLPYFPWRPAENENYISTEGVSRLTTQSESPQESFITEPETKFSTEKYPESITKSQDSGYKKSRNNITNARIELAQSENNLSLYVINGQNMTDVNDPMVGESSAFAEVVTTISEILWTNVGTDNSFASQTYFRDQPKTGVGLDVFSSSTDTFAFQTTTENLQGYGISSEQNTIYPQGVIETEPLVDENPGAGVSRTMFRSNSSSNISEEYMEDELTISPTTEFYEKTETTIYKFASTTKRSSSVDESELHNTERISIDAAKYENDNHNESSGTTWLEILKPYSDTATDRGFPNDSNTTMSHAALSSFSSSVSLEGDVNVSSPGALETLYNGTTDAIERVSTMVYHLHGTPSKDFQNAEIRNNTSTTIPETPTPPFTENHEFSANPTVDRQGKEMVENITMRYTDSDYSTTVNLSTSRPSNLTYGEMTTYHYLKNLRGINNTAVIKGSAHRADQIKLNMRIDSLNSVSEHHGYNETVPANYQTSEESKTTINPSTKEEENSFAKFDVSTEQIENEKLVNSSQSLVDLSIYTTTDNVLGITSESFDIPSVGMSYQTNTAITTGDNLKNNISTGQTTAKYDDFETGSQTIQGSHRIVHIPNEGTTIENNDSAKITTINLVESMSVGLTTSANFPENTVSNKATNFESNESYDITAENLEAVTNDGPTTITYTQTNSILNEESHFENLELTETITKELDATVKPTFVYSQTNAVPITYFENNESLKITTKKLVREFAGQKTSVFPQENTFSSGSVSVPNESTLMVSRKEELDTGRKTTPVYSRQNSTMNSLTTLLFLSSPSNISYELLSIETTTPANFISSIRHDFRELVAASSVDNLSETTTEKYSSTEYIEERTTDHGSTVTSLGAFSTEENNVAASEVLYDQMSSTTRQLRNQSDHSIFSALLTSPIPNQNTTVHDSKNSSTRGPRLLPGKEPTGTSSSNNAPNLRPYYGPMKLSRTTVFSILETTTPFKTPSSDKIVCPEHSSISPSTPYNPTESEFKNFTFEIPTTTAKTLFISFMPFPRPPVLQSRDIY